jgi:TonB family protein
MFDSYSVSPFRRRPWVLVTSVAVHCFVLFLLLRAPNPTIVKVQQLRQGNGGRSLARLYWSSEFPDSASTDASVHSRKNREQTIRSKQLQDPSKSLQLRLEKQERTLAANSNDRSASAGRSRDASTAGSRNGSLAYGDLTGTEVRPALWVGGPNPAIAASEFAEGMEGGVIVEITIDEQGNVVATQLLQGLSPAVDSRVLEALQLAHFIPAKRNGVSIPSKQDVYYHFPR